MLRKLAKTALLAIMAVLLSASFIACSDGNDENGIYCTITFNSNGGSDVKEQTVKQGNKAKRPNDPSKDGYIFLGWFYEGIVFDFDTKIMYNMTLKAEWMTLNNPGGWSDDGLDGDESGDVGSGQIPDGGIGGYPTMPSIPEYLWLAIGNYEYPAITRFYGDKLPEDGIVEIPEGVLSINPWVFRGSSKITRVIISDGLKTIGEEAFKDCTSLEEVTLPDSITTIYASAFANCTSLKKVSIPGSVVFTRDEKYGGWQYYKIFNGCTSLESVTIGDGMPTICPSMFAGCTALKSVEIPKSVKIIAYSAFEDCGLLESVTITEGVTSIESSAFRNCASLTSITIPGSVKGIGGNAFYNCKSLTEVVMEEGVEEIGSYAFYGCSSLTSITIPASVKEIKSDAFNMFETLTDVKFVDSTGWQYKDKSYNSSYKPVVADNFYGTVEDTLKIYLRSGYELKHN